MVPRRNGEQVCTKSSEKEGAAEGARERRLAEWGEILQRGEMSSEQGSTDKWARQRRVRHTSQHYDIQGQRDRCCDDLGRRKWRSPQLVERTERLAVRRPGRGGTSIVEGEVVFCVATISAGGEAEEGDKTALRSLGQGGLWCNDLRWTDGARIQNKSPCRPIIQGKLRGKVSGRVCGT